MEQWAFSSDCSLLVISMRHVLAVCITDSQHHICHVLLTLVDITAVLKHHLLLAAAATGLGRPCNSQEDVEEEEAGG
jgi:hypothetical protein